MHPAKKTNINRVLISRTDNIGDVILTLPMAGLLKSILPQLKIIFLGKKYTKAVVLASQAIDEFYDWDEIQNTTDPLSTFKKIQADAIIHVFPNRNIAKLACKAQISMRIGTKSRWYHWLYCNKKISLSRKNSTLHEAELNLKLLSALINIPNIPLLDFPRYYHFTPRVSLTEEQKSIIKINKINLILHPKSKGSAREWPARLFKQLAQSLPIDKFNIFISGTEDERDYIEKHILIDAPNVHNIVGKFNLDQFISFIAHCDGLIANSTGPLHISSALGKFSLGFYPPLHAMNIYRWGPIGLNAHTLVGKTQEQNNYCSNPCNSQTECSCLSRLSVENVKQIILEHFWTANVLENPVVLNH